MVTRYAFDSTGKCCKVPCNYEKADGSVCAPSSPTMQPKPPTMQPKCDANTVAQDCPTAKCLPASAYPSGCSMVTRYAFDSTGKCCKVPCNYEKADGSRCAPSPTSIAPPTVGDDVTSEAGAVSVSLGLGFLLCLQHLRNWWFLLNSYPFHLIICETARCWWHIAASVAHLWSTIFYLAFCQVL